MATCPRCDAEIQPDDRFCPTCGQRIELAAGPVDADFTPIDPALVPRRRRRRRPWFRRWRVMVPLVLIGMILLTLGAGAWYIKTRFDTLNELSTPPSEISGDRLGGDEELSIDTGPAQAAIREAEARREAARNNPPPTLAPTDAAGVAESTQVAGGSGQTAEAGATDQDGQGEPTDLIAPGGVDDQGPRVDGPTGETTQERGDPASTTSSGQATTDPSASISEGTERFPGGSGAFNGPPATDSAVGATTSMSTSVAQEQSTRQADAGEPGAAGGQGDSAGLPAGTAVIEVNPQGTPVLVSEPIGTPTLAQVPEPVEKDSYAVLMMGVDARPGEPIDIDVRPDSLFVAYLDGDDGSCRVLSIPRDTRTTLPGYGQSKINHALAVGGVPYEQLVVENLLGIELPHYGLIDFAGVEQLVDAVGGITVQNEYAFSTGEHTFPAGSIELTGEEALAYSRFRQDEQGDFGRQERQQAVVRALLTRGAGMDVVTEIPQLLGSVEDHVRTDLGLDEMVDIAQDFRASCTGSTLATDRIEGTVAWAYDDLMQQELSFVLVDPAEVQRKVAWLVGEGAPAGSPETPASVPTGTPAAIRQDFSGAG